MVCLPYSMYTFTRLAFAPGGAAAADPRWKPEAKSSEGKFQFKIPGKFELIILNLPEIFVRRVFFGFSPLVVVVSAKINVNVFTRCFQINVNVSTRCSQINVNVLTRSF